MRVFKSDSGKQIAIDRFPFSTQSGEVIFADEFENPVMGPSSEDGSAFDPNPKTIDFPPYKETVYTYTHGNVAVIALNTNYWYAPSKTYGTDYDGNLHAYIMDNQFDFLVEMLGEYEADDKIDHVFLTGHTPFFPNGGHVSDDMWCNGSNAPRPSVNGVPVEKGIIERRDEMLDHLVNRSSKVRAILTGDEHNYAKTAIGPGMTMHPEDYEHVKAGLTRTIYQINNGAAGAPYYAQEETPWSRQVSGFTTQTAVVFINIEGESASVRVVNPETLELIETFSLTE
jgi:hypothetical protein